jgi:pimeloyl-ACP methyl ester carboxylesterase
MISECDHRSDSRSAASATSLATGRPEPPTPTRQVTQLILLLAVAVGAMQRPPAPPDSGYVTTPDGVKLYYQEVGSGTETVIVPGRLFLIKALSRLAKGRRLIFYDTRSRGLSDAVHDSNRETIMDDVRDLETVRAHFGVDKVSIVGWSYMGLLVILYAKDYGEHVARVVQMGPVPPSVDMTFPPGMSEADDAAPDTAGVAKLRAMARGGLDRTRPKEYCQADWVVNRYALVGDRAHVGRLANSADGLCNYANEWPVNLSRHIDASFASIQRVRLSTSDFARVTMPVLIVHGTRDRNAPYGGGRAWAESLPQARLLTVRGGAHNSFDEYPGVVLPALERFLTGTWPAGAERLERH